MSRRRPSARLRDAQVVFSEYREAVNAGPPDLFSSIESVTEHAGPPRDFLANIESVTEHAGEPWREDALRVVRQLARERDEFTVEDVAPLVEVTYDRRALGGIMLEAKRRGWVEAAGYVNSGRERHGKPIRLWRSRLTGAMS